jgi:hypothetical protein
MVWVALSSLLLASRPGVANTYTVLNTHNSGAGSLYDAIVRANTHAGPDTIVFAPAMSGRTISPAAALPKITDPQTTINGDINGDGAPDVVLNGTRIPPATGTGTGLYAFHADRFAVTGLAINGFPGYGIFAQWSGSCTFRSCYFGVSLGGDAADANAIADLWISSADANAIGGTLPGQRNVFAAHYDGLRLTSSSGNVVVGNYFGVRPDGAAALGAGNRGIFVMDGCTNNRIGGLSAGARNLFGGLTTGVELQHAGATTVEGNYFGLAANGDTLLPLTSGVWLSLGASANTIGGTASGAGNVFAGNGAVGVRVESEGENKVQGNLFGSNAAGTAQRGLHIGVYVPGAAGPLTIGGNTGAAANYFTPDWFDNEIGVDLEKGGDGSLIRGNRFGLRHDGTAVPLAMAVIVSGVTATLTNNLFARCEYGVWCDSGGAMDSSGLLQAYGNTFSCTQAVTVVATAHCALGNLGDASTANDGGNVFRMRNTWDIWNETTNPIRAEGNDFGTTVRADIDAKIYDKLDNGALGRVDFIPLQGGVIPTGAGGGVAALAVTGAAAVPTATGAEILFTLSAPAEVTVEILNLAGRTVALPARATASNAGLQRLAWNGQSLTGTAAPAGRYLARITARNATGAQATVLVPVSLGH